MQQVQDSKLRADQVVPDFVLPSLDGGYVSPTGYKQRANLVILYADLDRCSSCPQALRSMSERYGEYRSLETEIILVAPQDLADLRGRLGILGLPFPVVSDAEGKMAKAYLDDGREHPALAAFITDRYGALRAEIRADQAGDLADQHEILSWLELIEMECPECGN